MIILHFITIIFARILIRYLNNVLKVRHHFLTWVCNEKFFSNEHYCISLVLGLVSKVLKEDNISEDIQVLNYVL